MTQIEEHTGQTVLFCRGEPSTAGAPPTTYDEIPADLRSGEFGPVLAGCRDRLIHVVGRRPKKAIDGVLRGRILVVGDDSDLNAVVLRLLRKDLLSDVEVAYATAAPTAVTRLYGLAIGPDAVLAAAQFPGLDTPLVRNDSGGVLVGTAEIAPLLRTFYVDAQRVPGGRASAVRVQPDASQGLTVTVTSARRGLLGRLRRTPTATYAGRAVEFGVAPGDGTVITFDGIRHPRDVKQWVFYKHIEPLQLVRPAAR